MTDYKIAAIPTEYRGRRYRSRLEARWAAFFDCLKWEHEYEAFDLSGWVPDFVIKGQKKPSGDRRLVLVEVKPIVEFDLEVAQKVKAAVKRAGFPILDVLILGLSPERHSEDLLLGWDLSDSYDHGPIGGHTRFKCFVDENGLLIDFSGSTKVGGGALTGFSSDYFWWFERGLYRPDLLESTRDYDRAADYIMSLWAEATNAVQWHPKGEKQ